MPPRAAGVKLPRTQNLDLKLAMLSSSDRRSKIKNLKAAMTPVKVVKIKGLDPFESEIVPLRYSYGFQVTFPKEFRKLFIPGTRSGLEQPSTGVDWNFHERFAAKGFEGGKSTIIVGKATKEVMKLWPPAQQRMKPKYGLIVSSGRVVTYGDFVISAWYHNEYLALELAFKFPGLRPTANFPAPFDNVNPAYRPNALDEVMRGWVHNHMKLAGYDNWYGLGPGSSHSFFKSIDVLPDITEIRRVTEWPASDWLRLRLPRFYGFLLSSSMEQSNTRAGGLLFTAQLQRGDVHRTSYLPYRGLSYFFKFLNHHSRAVGNRREGEQFVHVKVVKTNMQRSLQFAWDKLEITLMSSREAGVMETEHALLVRLRDVETWGDLDRAAGSFPRVFKVPQLMLSLIQIEEAIAHQRRNEEAAEGDEDSFVNEIISFANQRKLERARDMPEKDKVKCRYTKYSDAFESNKRKTRSNTAGKVYGGCVNAKDPNYLTELDGRMVYQTTTGTCFDAEDNTDEILKDQMMYHNTRLAGGEVWSRDGRELLRWDGEILRSDCFKEISRPDSEFMRRPYMQPPLDAEPMSPERSSPSPTDEAATLDAAPLPDTRSVRQRRAP